MSRDEQAKSPARLQLRVSPLALLVASAVSLMAQTAHAQTSASEATAAPAQAEEKKEVANEAKANSSLDSVTITATRRREPVREVPMQVNVMQSEQLERSGAKELADYIATQPGVNMTNSGSGGGVLSMRGLTSGPSQSIATVGVYVDDVATGMSSAFALGGYSPLNMGMLDLHHIEVLRGPQGTLYGAGAMGGVLKYVTNQPDTTEFSGNVKLGSSWTQDGGHGFLTNAVVNVPIKEDVAAVRIAAFSERTGGNYDAIGPAGTENVDRGRTNGARVSALLTPTRESAIRFTATHQDIGRNGMGFEVIDRNTLKPIYGERQRYIDIGEPFRNRTTLVAVDAEYDFGWARLNSITSSQDTKMRNGVDLTPRYGPFLRNLGINPSSTPVLSRNNQSRVSQEFRLTSRSGEAIEWLGGLYMTRERGSTNGQLMANLPNGTEMQMLDTGKNGRYREVAGYGNVTWHATKDLAVTGGVRVGRNNQSFTDYSTGTLVGNGSRGGGKSSETATTYLGTVKYTLDEISNVYFRAASGYRPGGPNGLKPNTNLAIISPQFKSDSLWSYELGYKADLMDRKLGFEAVLYNIEWSDMQVPIRDGGFSFYTNAGKARIQGLELTANYRPTAAWNFTASSSLINGKLREDSAGLQARSGSRLPNTPRIAFNLGANHNFTVAGQPAYAGMNVRYTGKTTTGYDGSVTVPNLKLGSYTLLDVQAGMDFKKFSVQAYVRNLANKRAIMSAETDVAGPNEAVAALTPSRTIGFTVNVPF